MWTNAEQFICTNTRGITAIRSSQDLFGVKSKLGSAYMQCTYVDAEAICTVAHDLDFRSGSGVMTKSKYLQLTRRKCQLPSGCFLLLLMTYNNPPTMHRELTICTQPSKIPYVASLQKHYLWHVLYNSYMNTLYYTIKGKCQNSPG